MNRLFRPLPALLLGLAATFAGGSTLAQYAGEEESGPWKEAPVPPAPALSTRNLVAVEQPGYSTLKVGVDLDSVELAPDGVVRYVMLLQSSEGARSAYYQGIRCRTYEVKTYARYDFSATPPGWQEVKTEWTDLHDARSRHAKNLARNGICESYAPPISTKEARRMIKRGKAAWMDPAGM